MQLSSSSWNRQGELKRSDGTRRACLLKRKKISFKKVLSKIAVGPPDQSKLRLFQPFGPRPLWRAQSQQRRKFLGARPACAGDLRTSSVIFGRIRERSNWFTLLTLRW